MGIKIVLTESQLNRLENNVGKSEVKEMRVSLGCTYMNYNSLVNFLGDKPSRKLGNNTIVHMVKPLDTREEEVAVKYWSTNIIRINPENVVTLNTNGHETNTTKDRLNQFLSCRDAYVFQKKHVWYIKNRQETIEYQDGMQILPDGHFYIPGGVDPRKISAQIEKMKDLDIDPKYRELYGLSDEEETN
jgi:IMP cyclohydrolase